MEDINDGGFIYYLKNLFINYFKKFENYLFLGLLTITFGLLWSRDGIPIAVKVFIIMANGFLIASLLTQFVLAIREKDFRRNKLLLLLFLITGLSSIIFFLWGYKSLNWSFYSGLIFMVPIIITQVCFKIRNWF
ncbi:hypothetical protein J0A67_06590 [Algoriphagus aestuariicola]|jgi:uncharacterized membrane protein|uniref:Uncharacterized protein n=1 Tax=Algoriphagus aestuariicola TaxID=1852016 RepID=A0ABS3BS67_9BACT|nr:hypothetical protein [Algoriphagus aestuariicola]MBN7800519.1 hypothetical protein [Algoriphagus aestuariicola]